MNKILMILLESYYKLSTKALKVVYFYAIKILNLIVKVINKGLWLTYKKSSQAIGIENTIPKLHLDFYQHDNEIIEKLDGMSSQINSLSNQLAYNNNLVNMLFINDNDFTNNLLYRDLLKVTSKLHSNDYDKFSSFIGRFLFLLKDFSHNLYERLNDEDKTQFLKWILMHYAVINILSEDEKKSTIDEFVLAESLPKQVEEDRYIIDLSKINYDVRLNIIKEDYWYPAIIVSDFIRKQYEYKPVCVKQGDVILDCGGYIGDTALTFGHDTNWNCEVHCFEILDFNMYFLNRNIENNPKLKNVLKLNKIALSSKSGEIVSFSNWTSATKLIENGEFSIGTITIDDYVKQNNLSKVDFIKMDMEGAEATVLQGASETISKFKPKLALSVYHEIDDCKTIPELVLKYNPNYKFHFNWHNKRNGIEAILYAYDSE